MLDLKEEYLCYSVFGNPNYEFVSYEGVGRNSTLYFKALLLRVAMDCPGKLTDALIQRLGIFDTPMPHDMVAQKFQITIDRLRFAESRFLRKFQSCQKYTTMEDYSAALRNYNEEIPCEEQILSKDFFERFSPFS